MRKKMLMLVLVLGGVVAGTLAPKQALSVPYCPPWCLDPQLTCCIPCWYVPGQGCVCGDFCVLE